MVAPPRSAETPGARPPPGDGSAASSRARLARRGGAHRGPGRAVGVGGGIESSPRPGCKCRDRAQFSRACWAPDTAKRRAGTPPRQPSARTRPVQVEEESPSMLTVAWFLRIHVAMRKHGCGVELFSSVAEHEAGHLDTHHSSSD